MKNMDIDYIKEDRARGREKSLRLSKQKRKARRSGSEQGKHKIGNGCGNFCTYCLPSLINSIHRKRDAKIKLKEEMREVGTARKARGSLCLAVSSRPLKMRRVQTGSTPLCNVLEEFISDALRRRESRVSSREETGDGAGALCPPRSPTTAKKYIVDEISEGWEIV